MANKALDWARSHFRQLAILAVSAIVVVILARVGYARFGEDRGWAGWTGFGALTAPDGTYYPAKTLWDVFDLLIVPLVLALGAYWFNKSEKANERKIADDRQKEQALQNYLDKITELMLEKSLPEKKHTPDDPVVEAAQIRTITTLRTLDLGRKNILLQFLRDSKLADFILSGASLLQADLSAVKLSMANLHKANLHKANLSGAELIGADLSRAVLSEAKLSKAVLMYANLSGAELIMADLTDANLGRAILSGAVLEGANLHKANLSGAVLEGADLRGTDLILSDLSEAILRGADLSGAHLTGATIAPEQIATVKSLSGAIMPDGSKHE